MTKVALHSLGCKVNQYETEAVKQMFGDKGYQIVSFSDKADIYIVNTCTVTNIADKKSRQMLSRAKKINDKAIIVAVGCYAQIAEKELKENNDIDLIIGNTKKNNIVNIVENYIKHHDKISTVEDISVNKDYEDLWLTKLDEKTRATIKIQDGCNQFCSYCIIPYVRGRVRSREVSSILKEVNEIVRNGYKEIVLTGIHLASYGIEFNNYKLIDLLEELNAISGLERIRLGSLEPNLVTQAFVDRLEKLNKICPHFHLSLQSGCDETLKRMNRKYSTDDYYNSVTRLRRIFDNPSITTDIIVGFPGETDEEFKTTIDFVNKVKFADIHIFKYSPRQGTKAAESKNQIRNDIKSSRSKLLNEYKTELYHKYLKQYIGEQVSVLFEKGVEINEEQYWVGHTGNYLKVYISEVKDLENSIVNVEIKDTFEDGLIGKPGLR